ncbi:ParB/RepB/Spo0J family partition protein [Streptomyces zhihengii]
MSRPWVGRMRTSLLNDRQVRPTEYQRWADAHRYFQQRDKDRRLVDQLKESILRDGLRTPIIIGVSDRHPTDAYVAEGHHRAVALIELGAADFPFTWYWIRSWGVHYETRPYPDHLPR